MSKSYIIQWKSRVNGRAGRGTKLFSRDEADQLAAELNLEYPQILHEVVSIPTQNAEPEPEQEQTTKAESEKELEPGLQALSA